jgi:asparagine synthase (glutamine-hydrolysing)
LCGICGFVNSSKSERCDQSLSNELIQSMVDTLVHRGPDGQGVKGIDNVFLGHTRLSIIDLNLHANQPFFNQGKGVYLVFNGEIYNYKKLRLELISKGYKFKTASDTEVLLISYEEWGINCLEKFEGMFAFALYDQKKGITHLVRDRLGKKPLFYSAYDGCVAFGSEIKSLLTHKEIDRSVDPQSLDDYLSLNYCIADRTLFDSIKQLKPGERIEIDNSCSIKKIKYWDIDYQNHETNSKSYYFDKFEALLEDSISKRLDSDVPLGAFLSGGIDSSVISYYSSKNKSNRLNTFSVGFDDASYNELPYAKIVSDKINSKHRSIIVSNVEHNTVEKIVWHSEEPTADSSMVPMYFLSKLAKEHVSVCLSGDGADEILAGYETYSAYYLASAFKMIPQSLRNTLINKTLSLMPVTSKKYNFREKLTRFAYASNFDNYKMHYSWRCIFDDELKKELLNKEMDRNINGHDASLIYKSIFESNATSLNKMLYSDTTVYLPNDMLVKVDRMSMAHSLEVRAPFLDHKLVDLAFQIPDKYKLKNLFNKKYILKEVMRDKLPEIILNRKKAGFNSPVSYWLKNSLKESSHDYILSDKFLNNGFFNPEVIIKLLNDHSKGVSDNSHKIWSLYILSIWFEMFNAKVKLT